MKHGYLIGRPGKKERVLYARQRRPEQIGRHHQSACRRIHEHWSNRSTLHYKFSGRRGHWYIDNRDGTFSMKEAGRAWADNVSRFSGGNVKAGMPKPPKRMHRLHSKDPADAAWRAQPKMRRIGTSRWRGRENVTHHSLPLAHVS